MTKTLLAFALLVCFVFLPCIGSEVGPHSLKPAEVRSDEVSLLQAQVEVKKNEAKEARLAAVQEDAEDDASEVSRSSCAAFGCNAVPAASFGLTFPAGEPAADAAEVPAVKKAPDVSTVARAPVPAGKASTPILGTILEVLACVLIADVLRRWTCKDKDGSAADKAASASPLLKAALAGDAAAFEASVAVCEQELSQVDSWGCTALHYAAKGGSVEVVKRLLELGAEVDAIDAWDETPLHLAARGGHIKACETLLAAGACIDATNAEERTPLVLAGQAGNEAVCNMLIQRGAGVAGMPNEEVPSLIAGLLMQEVLSGSPVS